MKTIKGIYPFNLKLTKHLYIYMSINKRFILKNDKKYKQALFIVKK